jgi:hypothetical protein
MMLSILAYVSNFSVIALIGLRTLDTACFNVTDINLSLAGLVFSLMAEIMEMRK